MTADESEVHWTAKLPLLIAGILVGLVGIVAVLWRKSPLITALGVLLLLVAVGFIGWSMTIKDWCIMHSDFGGDFSPDLAGCLKLKGWFQF